MISGLVLKYLNGECFVIRRGYETSPPRLKLVLSDSASQKARKNCARGVLRTKRVNRKVKSVDYIESLVAAQGLEPRTRGL